MVSSILAHLVKDEEFDEFFDPDDIAELVEQYKEDSDQEEIVEMAKSDFPQRGVTNIRNEEWLRKQMSAGHKLLYMALISLCGRRSYCEVSHETLADMTCSSVASIKRWLGDLATPMRGRDPIVTITTHRFKNLNRYELPQLTPINWTKSKKLWAQKRAERVSSI